MSPKPRSIGSSHSSAGTTLTSAPVVLKVMRPSPSVYVSRRLTRKTPPEVWTQGRSLSSHREVISCIWGAVLVVVARLRAASVLRLSCWPGTAESVVSVIRAPPIMSFCTESYGKLLWVIARGQGSAPAVFSTWPGSAVAVREPGREDGQRRPRAGLDRGGVEGFHRLLDPFLDHRLDLVERARLAQDAAELGRLLLAQLRIAVPGVEVGLLPGGRPRQRVRDQHGVLALAQVVEGRLAGLAGRAERAEYVVAELERLAERQPEPGVGAQQGGLAPGQRAADLQRPLDGVLGRLVADRRQRLLDARPGAELGQHVQILAADDLGAHGVEQAVRGPQPVRGHVARRQQGIR